MTGQVQKETLEFQTEAKQLLQLMIHSLYSNKEIFLRELISNASDACDKLRFEAISDDSLYEGDGDLEIRIEFDPEHKTVSITDNGIGMSRDEVISHIGTIAKSGTRDFLNALTGDQKKDSQLIGQFGVGFYSAFIVAEKVEVLTRRAGQDADAGVHWESSGEGSYTLEPVSREKRGTTVILHLRDEDKEFLDRHRISNVIRKYSDHINLPVKMQAAPPAAEQEGEATEATPEWEVVNSASALWTRGKKDITAEEYNEFYKSMTFDFEEPLAHIHNHVEGNQSYTSLFYIPKNAPFDLWDRERRAGIKLYVKRVFIMDDAEHLMPNYLRFVRGLVDSDDLPLNVSREILQSNPMIDKIRAASVKKILGLLEDIAKKDKEQYQVVWDAFGRVLKEGPGEDFGNRERIAGLLRFSTSRDNREEADVSLAEYIERMKPEQKHIYYLTADSFSAAKNSPHLEIFRKKDIEVLLLHDRVDEWLMSHLQEFDGKTFQSVAKGALDLGEPDDVEEKQKQEKSAEEYKDIIARMKEALGERVSDVRLSQRLTDSPSCLVVEEGEMAINLQNMLKQAGHDVPRVQPVLEINPDHVLVKQLQTESDSTRFENWTLMLFDQALLSEVGQLDNPAEFVGRLNDMFSAFVLTR